MENQVADHLFILKDDTMARFEDGLEINNMFPKERVLAASHDLIPWFADYANYLVSDMVPPDMTSHQC